MSAATPVTCASTSVSMNRGNSPACAQKATSCKAPDNARVSTPASISSRKTKHLPLCALRVTNAALSQYLIIWQQLYSCRVPARSNTMSCFSSADTNECETGVHQCTNTQTCVNIYGGYQCVDTNRCQDPYVQVSEKWVTPHESLCVFIYKQALSHTLSQLHKYVLAISSEYNQPLYGVWLNCKITPNTFSTYESNLQFSFWVCSSAIKKLLQSDQVLDW